METGYLKNSTEVANSKCYAYASSTLLCLFFTLNFKNDKYLVLLDIFCPPPPPLCWAGYGPDQSMLNDAIF